MLCLVFKRNGIDKGLNLDLACVWDCSNRQRLLVASLSIAQMNSPSIWRCEGQFSLSIDVLRFSGSRIAVGT